MKQRIPTQFLQINLASSDEIKNWAERLTGVTGFYRGVSQGDQTATVAASQGPKASFESGGVESAKSWRASGTTPIGEVKKADTLNYRTLKPEKDGLFCERIFGPTIDWICSCGQTKERGMTSAFAGAKVTRGQNGKDNGRGGATTSSHSPNTNGIATLTQHGESPIISPWTTQSPGSTDHEKALYGAIPIRVCPICQVEATTSRFRRYRMGYIGLACPVTHIWYLNSRPNLFSILLKIPTKYIKKIAYYKAYSPSLARPEYLSALLAPGGDFFDNEWEYLHWWLSGKYSFQDIIAPWNFVSLKLASMYGSGYGTTSSHSASTASPVENEAFGPCKDYLKPRPYSLSAPRGNNNSGGAVIIPEFPNWLENTGAQALLNQLETKNWDAEINKLERWCTPGVGFVSNSGYGRGGAAKQEFQATKPTPAAPSVAYPQLRRKNRIRQLKLLKIFKKSGFPTTQMIFSNIPVLPPELRPIIQLGGGSGGATLGQNSKSGGQLASSDVNDLYRRVISRNNRLKYYLYETHFVEFLVRSEQQLVQLAVDALIENGKTTQVRHTSGQKRLYKSLSDRIGGKQGRFRMNLLGKRVDYSGRSVIVVGPQLHISNCGLPYEMATELFQPFLLRHLLEANLCKTIRSAKNILRLNKAFARQILHLIIGSHPILLNRAPTLHRLGIQAFQPILVFGRAIHLHPLVCPAFNADFDGDQMAVHIPLSPSSRVEARLLMLASGNWLSASTGQPNLLPSQDMVLGFYYVTLEKYGFQKGKGKEYQNIHDALQAYYLGELDLHSQIWVNIGAASASQQSSLSYQCYGSDGTTTLSQSAATTVTCDKVVMRPSGEAVSNDDLQKSNDRGKILIQSRQSPSFRPLAHTAYWETKKSYHNVTGDSLSRKSSVTKHNLKLKSSTTDPYVKNGASSSALPLRSRSSGYGSGYGSAAATTSSHSAAVSSLTNSLSSSKRYQTVDQPLQIRLNTDGIVTKIYTSYQWKENIGKNIIFSYVRTTPGRLLLNQIMQKYL
jgi:DNA-directed RNA polymerase beta' subunit